MQQQSTAALAGRAAFVVLVAFGLMLCGVALDMLAGTGPMGTLGFVAIGSIFGTVMLCVIIVSSFPKPDADRTAEAKPGATDKAGA